MSMQLFTAKWKPWITRMSCKGFLNILGCTMQEKSVVFARKCKRSVNRTYLCISVQLQGNQ
jgi:hypothetical protein